MIRIVAVDVDGTVAGLHPVWLGRYNYDFNDNLQVEDIVDWNIHQFAKPECGKQMYKYIEDPSLYNDVLPITGSLEVISELKVERKDLRFVYVTNSTIGTAGRKYTWLKQYGFLDKQDDYVEAKDKSLIKADMLIDDYQENLISFIGYKLLLHSAWNRAFRHPDVCRVNNWFDIKYMIGKFFPREEY